MMRRWQFTTLLVLAIVCLALSAGTVVIARVNQRLQKKLQMQQAQINSGILGQRGQQISAQILQDMANVTLSNQRMKDLLMKHGYNVEGPAQPAAKGTNAVERSENADN